MTKQQEQTRRTRREQVERCLAADMTVKEWCELNRVPVSTMYYWMSKLRREEPDLFDDTTCGEWIELSRGSIAARTALAVRHEDAPVTVDTVDGATAAAAVGNALVVRVNGTDVVVPEGVAEPHLAMVLRAVASL